VREKRASGGGEAAAPKIAMATRLLRAYMRLGEGGMATCHWCQLVLPICWRLFFHFFCQNYMDAKFIYQTIGVALILPMCWRLIFVVLTKLDGCQIDMSNCWMELLHG
jgi:hypothetical protein